MNKKIKSIVGLIGFLSFVFAINANAAAWTGWYKVEYIYSNTSGVMYVRLDPSSAHLNPGGCPRNEWYVFNKEATNYDEMYRMLLTAKSADREVRVWVSDECSSNRPVMLNTWIR